ncbi:NTP transferase domain-containing protein [Lachnospiraceae bacterium 62-35]
MKALILNSGLGHRMGDITKTHPKCMTEIPVNDTIISRQLKLLLQAGIKDIVITTGYFDQILINYCNSLNLPLNIKFVNNPLYDKTNYIYSIYCAKGELDDDIILMHGDLVFEDIVLTDILKEKNSCMKVSSTIPLPEKDFKAAVRNGRVYAIGVEFFDETVEAQALYKLNRTDWKKWLNKIVEYCEKDKCNCYAETAFNEISNDCAIHAFDVKDALCAEIDNPEDLEKVSAKLKSLLNKQLVKER